MELEERRESKGCLPLAYRLLPDRAKEFVLFAGTPLVEFVTCGIPWAECSSRWTVTLGSSVFARSQFHAFWTGRTLLEYPVALSIT